VLRQGLAMLATSVGLALGVAACGNGAGRPLVIPKNGLGVQATTTTTTPDQAVIAGWIAAENALAHASRTLNPNDPALAATFAPDPSLMHTQLLIAAEKAAGDTVRGRENLGHPVVVSYSPTKAIVHSCVIDDSVLYETNGQPVPGLAGTKGPVEEVSVMIPGPNGNWLMSSLTGKIVASCPA
jgi:hypothetical protein